MRDNSNLHRANKAKNDEFYTQLTDIEKELQHYNFRGKAIFLPCDDPRRSNFWKYFSDNFNKTGITKLVSCHLAKEGEAFSMEKTAQEDEGVRTYLSGDGGFETPESKSLLEECDVIVTNPPFSKFRSFMPILFDSGKEFLIMGSLLATTYKIISPRVAEGSLWLGVNNRNMWFEIPAEFADASKQGVRLAEDGRCMKEVNVRWFTNMGTNSHKPFLKLTKTYAGNEQDYQRYSNYDAINVDRVKSIPRDYNGIMGVPINFLEKWNPDQFEILGALDKPMIGERYIFKRYIIRRIGSDNSGVLV